MKKFVILCTIFACSVLYAYDWAQEGIAVIERSQVDGRTELTLKDEAGRTFSLSYSEEPDSSMLKKIVELKDEFYGWKDMEVQTLRFIYDQGGLDIALMPKSYDYHGVNMIPYMPSGMQFNYTHILRYNFRINVDRLFVRIAGDYANEEELSRKIADAVKNPDEYVRKRDPEYLLTRLEQLEDNFNKLRTSVLMLHNSGFLSGASPINVEVIQRVIELRREDPAITREMIAKKLKKENIKASTREIKLILNVYFNDFSD